MVYTDQWEAAQDEVKRDIDLKDKSAGIYFLQIETENTRINHKLLIK